MGVLDGIKDRQEGLSKRKPNAKCPSCGFRFRWSGFPLFVDGRFVWQNLFKTDFMSVVFFVVIISLVFLYNYEIGHYEDIRSDPLGYCDGYCHSEYLCVNRSVSERVYDIDVPLVVDSSGGEGFEVV